MHNFFYYNISTIQNINNLGWKAQFFKSAHVSMLGHGCGVSQYPQFYDRTKHIYQMLPHEKGYQFWHKPWILVLAKSVETFFMVSISDTPTIK